MKESKNKLTDYEKVMKSFKEDFDDNELQERFNNFEKTLDDLKERYNKHIPEVNSKMKMSQDLAQMILDSAMMGFLNNDAIKKANEINSYLDGIRPHLDELRDELQKKNSLIDKYRELTNNKLFQYWKTIKAIEENTPPWLEWKKDYDKRIF